MATSTYASMETEELIKLLEETEEELYDEELNLYRAKTLGEKLEELKRELKNRGCDDYWYIATNKISYERIGGL